MKEREKFPFIKISDAKLTEDIDHESSIVYSSIELRNLHLDIFYPKAKTKLFPALILLHGAGWRSGDKSQQIPMAIEIAKSGFVTATIEYRLSPKAKYPAAIYVIKSAIRWLRANNLNILSIPIRLLFLDVHPADI